MIADDDWLIRKQIQLLQDMVEAKAIAVELLEDLTVLADMLVKNARRTGTQVPNREAFCHLIERVHVLLDASHETTNKLLQGVSDVTKSKQNPKQERPGKRLFLLGRLLNRGLENSPLRGPGL